MKNMITLMGMMVAAGFLNAAMPDLSEKEVGMLMECEEYLFDDFLDNQGFVKGIYDKKKSICNDYSDYRKKLFREYMANKGAQIPPNPWFKGILPEDGRYTPRLRAYLHATENAYTDTLVRLFFEVNCMVNSIVDENGNPVEQYKSNVCPSTLSREVFEGRLNIYSRKRQTLLAVSLDILKSYEECRAKRSWGKKILDMFGNSGCEGERQKDFEKMLSIVKQNHQQHQ